jgi:hypothetical protein
MDTVRQAFVELFVYCNVLEMRDEIVVSIGRPNFNESPWDSAILVTPRHAVLNHWNEASALKHCQKTRTRLFICNAYDTIDGRGLTLTERVTVLSTVSKRGRSRRRRGGLPNKILLAVGLRVMVTFNINTNIDIANGARGEVVKVVVDDRDAATIGENGSVVELKYPPVYVLVKLLKTRATALQDLEGVVPITAIAGSFKIDDGIEKRVTRIQMPLTGADAFTDYRSQGQTIQSVIVDIGRPPTGGLTPFNA